MVVCNTPMIFRGIYSLIQGWIDEKTRSKISLCGTNYYSILCEYIDEDIIPTFLGGKNDTPIEDDLGPWCEYEVVDGYKEGDIVGIRRRPDPFRIIKTPQDIVALKNPNIEN